MRRTWLIAGLLVLTGLLPPAEAAVNKPKNIAEEQLITVAEKAIQQDGYIDFARSKFPQVSVRLDKEGARVSFSRQVYFLPLNSTYLYDATVSYDHDDQGKLSLYAPTLSLGIKDNYSAANLKPLLNPTRIKCFEFTPAYRAKLDFVVRSINASKELGRLDLNKLPPNLKMTVTECQDYYQVEIDHQYYSYYKIRKRTGQVFDAGHKHYLPKPEE